jgi:hypothetical protein
VGDHQVSFRDNLLEAMTERLAGKDYISGYYDFELGDRKVVDYEEDTEQGGGCETCWYEYAVIEYEFDDGTTLVEQTSFAELMQEL